MQERAWRMKSDHPRGFFKRPHQYLGRRHSTASTFLSMSKRLNKIQSLFNRSRVKASSGADTGSLFSSQSSYDLSPSNESVDSSSSSQYSYFLETPTVEIQPVVQVEIQEVQVRPIYYTAKGIPV